MVATFLFFCDALFVLAVSILLFGKFNALYDNIKIESRVKNWLFAFLFLAFLFMISKIVAFYWAIGMIVTFIKAIRGYSSGIRPK